MNVLRGWRWEEGIEKRSPDSPGETGSAFQKGLTLVTLSAASHSPPLLLFESSPSCLREHYPPLAHCCFLISLHAISSSSTQALNVEATWGPLPDYLPSFPTVCCHVIEFIPRGFNVYYVLMPLTPLLWTHTFNLSLSISPPRSWEQLKLCPKQNSRSQHVLTWVPPSH